MAEDVSKHTLEPRYNSTLVSPEQDKHSIHDGCALPSAARCRRKFGGIEVPAHHVRDSTACRKSSWQENSWEEGCRSISGTMEAGMRHGPRCAKLVVWRSMGPSAKPSLSGGALRKKSARHARGIRWCEAIDWIWSIGDRAGWRPQDLAHSFGTRDLCNRRLRKTDEETAFM